MYCVVSSISDREAQFRVGEGEIVERQKRDPSRGVRGNWLREILKTRTLEMQCDFLRFGHQILVAILVTLQDLVTL